MRIFLDELKPNDGEREVEPPIDCSLTCNDIFNDHTSFAKLASNCHKKYSNERKEPFTKEDRVTRTQLDLLLELTRTIIGYVGLPPDVERLLHAMAEAEATKSLKSKKNTAA